MTLVPTPTPGQLVHDDGKVVGLEDINDSDLATPRLAFDHEKGVMKNTLSNEEYEQITLVMLGAIKQRILWAPEMDEDTKSLPWCRSYDNSIGIHNLETFPYDEAGFDPQSPEDPCTACALKEWTTVAGKNKPPRCSEQLVIPVLIPTPDGKNFSPAIFTIQRSAMSNGKKYIGSFQAAKTPLFTAFTTITLDHRKRGMVSYVVPEFKKGAPTDEALYPEFTNRFFALRQFITTPRTFDEEDAAPAAAAPAAAPAKVKNEPAPVAAEDYGEEPF